MSNIYSGQSKTTNRRCCRTTSLNQKQRRTQGGCLGCETTPFGKKKREERKKREKGKWEKAKKEKKKEEEKVKIGIPIIIRGRVQVNFETFQQEHFEKIESQIK